MITKIESVNELISKGKKIIKKYQKSTNFQRELQEMQNQLKMKPNQLQSACETRWNSRLPCFRP